MKVLKFLVLLTGLSVLPLAGIQAQELKCTIQLNHQKITGVDPSTFQALQASMTEFMNQRAWTQDV
ncbi:MAG: hypothetical protein JWO03_610, partial [Bacteroidetes bacterium]|nr:hypothetical protein [Bacteroidota bacterium]